MSFDLENYKWRLRDPKILIEMARELRKLPQDERYLYIKQIIVRDSLIGMQLSNRCLSSKTMLTEIFRNGLQSSNASSIKFWIETALPRLGASETVAIMESYARSEPKIVQNALYWLPDMLPENDPKTDGQLCRLQQSLESFDVTSFEMEPAEREAETVAA